MPWKVKFQSKKVFYTEVGVLCFMHSFNWISSKNHTDLYLGSTFLFRNESICPNYIEFVIVIFYCMQLNVFHDTM
ncbi:hypothetical protein E2320_015351, partial [Naja naja]